MDDANTEYNKAQYSATSQLQVATDNAAATAWTDWAASVGDPYATYDAASNAANYAYDAALNLISLSANNTSLDAHNQWVHDISGGWLTYQNDLADHALANANTVNSAAVALTSTLASNTLTFATTVAPAIQTAADAECNNGYQAMQAASSAAEGAANNKATAALAETDAEIDAWQTVNDTFGDNAEQQVNSASAAGIIFIGTQAAAIGQLAPVDPSASEPADALKAVFTSNLSALLAESGLNQMADASAFKSDVPKTRTERSGKPGFDCDDFAFALHNFLSRNFQNDASISLSLMKVTYSTRVDLEGNPTNYKAHAVNIVTNGDSSWVVDSQSAEIRGPYSTWLELCDAVRSLMIARYRTSPDAHYIFTEFSDPDTWQSGHPDEPLAWYTDSFQRRRIEELARGLKKPVDPSLWYPLGWLPSPPQPFGPQEPFPLP